VFCTIKKVSLCFNPCFAGFPFRTVDLSVKCKAESCFNPCFAGFPFRTHSNNNPIANIPMFQSLFCWISVSDLH